MTTNFVSQRQSLKYLYWVKTSYYFFIYLYRRLFSDKICLSTTRGWPRHTSDMMESQVKEAHMLRVEDALKKHGDSILRLSLSYLHNLSDAEDIIQETLLQMLRKAPVFECSEHEKAWLLRVAINLCKNKITYTQRRRYEELSESLTGDIPEDLSFVWEAVGSLPIKYREVIHLFYEEDMPTSKIAELLNKKETTIRSLLHRARELLKRKLKEVYDFEE